VRVAAGTLRMLESAITGTDPAVKWLARRQLRDLIEQAEWNAADLPPARTSR